MNRRHQCRMQDIRIEQKRQCTGEALGTICAARTIAEIMLCAGVVVRPVFEHRGGIVLWCHMARMHTSGIRRRCSRHRQHLHHRRTGKRQCQNKRKCEAWQGHAANSNIANRARQTARGTRMFSSLNPAPYPLAIRPIRFAKPGVQYLLFAHDVVPGHDCSKDRCKK